MFISKRRSEKERRNFEGKLKFRTGMFEDESHISYLGNPRSYVITKLLKSQGLNGKSIKGSQMGVLERNYIHSNQGDLRTH